MTNTLVASIYIPFAIITVVILIQVLLRDIKHKGNYFFIFLCLLVICWYASNIIEALTNSVSLAGLVFVGFIPPVLLLFVLDFYQITFNRAKKFVPLIFLIPSVVAIMVFTSDYHSLIYVQLDAAALTFISDVPRAWGPWFWVHTVHCYIMSILIIAAILIRHFHLPRFYRLPSNLMTMGIGVTLLSNILTLLQLFPAAIDPTLIATSLALMFFNQAIISNDRSKFVRYSHGKVFDYLDLYILVMDEIDRVVHVNRPANEWLSSLGITYEFHNIGEIMESFTSRGAVQKESEGERGIDISFPSKPLPTVLNMYIQKMADPDGDHIGSVAIFTDVTQNRLLLSRLEEKAGMDSLTGIANRMAYEGARTRLDSPEHLPLSVIMCDVNGLKSVNDNLGHQYGDMMLQAVSEILEASCPKPGFIARIGGDEFVYLLSNTSEEMARAFTDKIRENLQSRKNLPFPLSVAMGAATKYSADENISDITDLADSRMYANKKWIKSQQQ